MKIKFSIKISHWLSQPLFGRCLYICALFFTYTQSALTSTKYPPITLKKGVIIWYLAGIFVLVEADVKYFLKIKHIFLTQCLHREITKKKCKGHIWKKKYIALQLAIIKGRIYEQLIGTSLCTLWKKNNVYYFR